MKGTASSRQRGFTLLEVMIALAIVGTALITLLALGQRSIDVNGRLQRITRATLLAQQQMTQIELRARQGGTEPEAGTGVFPPPFEEFRWRSTFEPTPLPSVTQVTVTVAWGEEARNEKVDLSSFLFR